jgi:hypothetical protein
MHNDAVRSILGMTASASAATTAAAAMCGALELGWPAGPINAVSHILWGADAIRHDEMSGKSVLHHFVFRPDRRPPGMAPALARGAATAALAYVVDYHVVPKRLTPGFEERLSGRSLFAIYGALAVSLAIGERASRS